MQHRVQLFILALFVGLGVTIGCSEIQTADPVKNLTNSDADDRYPSWSPSGEAVLFESNRNGNWDIFQMKPDGSNVVQLTDSILDERFPAWGPEGNHILYTQQESDVSSLVVQNLQDSSVKVLRPHSEGIMLFPDWSPDAKRIAYSLNVNDSLDIYVHNLASGESTKVSNSQFRSVWPRWSPQGNRIGFFSRMDTNGQDDEIYSMSSDGSSIQRITTKPGHDFCPTWSQSGDKLGIASVFEDGSRQISIVDLYGQILGAVGKGFERVTEPSWSPDGTKMLYVGRMNGTYDVYSEEIEI